MQENTPPTGDAGNTPATDATANTNAGPEIMPSMEELLKKAELTAQEHHDAWLRAKAETENVRRRAQEDIAKASKFAVERFAGEVPPRFLVGPGFGLIRNDQILVQTEKRMEERGTWQGRLC